VFISIFFCTFAVENNSSIVFKDLFMDISVIVPLFNEAESLPVLHEWIVRVMRENNFSYEIIFINDGSTDSSWQVIKQLREQNEHVHGICFRRNYGKSAALYCGFDAAQGNVVITMDADLQDSPDEIPELYRMIVEEKYDLVSGWKQKRYDNKLTKNIPSKLFNATARWVTGIKLHDMNCGLKAYRQDVIKNIELFSEMHRYIPYLAKNAGFTRIGEKVVQHRKREFGESKFGINRFVNGYLDLMTLWFLNKFGKQPMHFFGLIGSVMFILGFIAVIVVGAMKLYALAHHTSAMLVADTPYFHLGILTMVLGCMLFLAGFLGELIIRNSSERNNYLIRETL
jgi:glycosyltransferase involved in cell wall biosynthesis